MNEPKALTDEKHFDVLVRIQIHGAFATLSSSDVWLERRLTLPFAPTVGIRFMDGDWTSPPMNEIYWETAENRFKCYLESDKEIYNAIMRKQHVRPIKEVVQEYLNDGWQLERDDE